MQLFYTQHFQGDNAILGEEESRHCTKVLRKKVGDIIHFIDGKGGLYQGEITELNKRDTWLKIIHKEEQKARDFRIHIAIAPTKNIARIEWFLEKCVEIGVDEVTFLLCEHSERTKIRLDRLEKIALSAAKQSLKAFVPTLKGLVSYKEFISKMKENSAEKYICWVNEDNHHLLHTYTPKSETIILIGPEGDFSSAEIEMALTSDFKAVGLGESRLRTETAGIVACHIIHLGNEISTKN